MSGHFYDFNSSNYKDDSERMKHFMTLCDESDFRPDSERDDLYIWTHEKAISETPGLEVLS